MIPRREDISRLIRLDWLGALIFMPMSKIIPSMGLIHMDSPESHLKLAVGLESEDIMMKNRFQTMQLPDYIGAKKGGHAEIGAYTYQVQTKIAGEKASLGISFVIYYSVVRLERK
jgi:hypothetical protein